MEKTAGVLEKTASEKLIDAVHNSVVFCLDHISQAASGSVADMALVHKEALVAAKQATLPLPPAPAATKATTGVADDKPIELAPDSGSGNSFICLSAFAPALTAYKDGALFAFKATHPNSGSSSLSIDALGPVNIKRNARDLVLGDILDKNHVLVRFNGTTRCFEMVD